MDVIEPIAKFTAELDGKHGVGKVLNVGLEEWDGGGEDERYDLIWNQWCMGHLNDVQLVAYLELCRARIADEGYIIVKENITTGLEDEYDAVDSSVTRYVSST